MNVPSVDAQDLLVHDYLTAVAHAAADLPAVHRDELLADLSEHIAVARSQCEPTEAGVRTILDRLGHPLAIVDAARGLATGPGYGYASDPYRGFAAGAAYGWWAGAAGAPRAAGGAAPAAAPYGSLAAIWHRSPLAVAIIVVAALGLLVIVVGLLGVTAVTPPGP